MAIDFIKIDPANTNPQAVLLRTYIQALRQAFDLGTRIVAIMGNNNDGTNFAPIEPLFGIPSGQGQAVFTLVNGAIGSMNGTFQTNNAKTLTEQVG